MRNTPLALVLTCLLAGPAALAEKADRGKPMTIEADQPSTLDMARQMVVFVGNVVVAQGTLSIRADRIEVRDRPDGYRSALAIGLPGKPASFRQKREGLDEFVTGQAERIEFDSRGDVVRFIGNAQVRRLRGDTSADEITGGVITYDNGNETFSVQGAAPAPNAATASSAPGGRVRVVLTPRPEAASGVKP